MDAAIGQTHGEHATALVAHLPSRVIVALDHFTPAERASVEHAAGAFARGEAKATRLPDPEPLYLVRATPTLLVLLHREAGQPVVVEDVMTQESWDRLAHAR
jgi:hypothetical protein